MARTRIAVVGVGHLGKEHARIVAGLPEAELVGVADVNPEQAELIARRHGTRACRDHRTLLDGVDAAVLAVPTTHHHAVATDFLRRGIPLLIEKPLALTLAQADELVELAGRQGTFVQVGHIERFNPAFEELQRRPLQPKFVTCERIGPFTGRSLDIGVVLDLMIHDLDLLLALVRAPLRSVHAVGVAVLGGHEDVAHAHLVFANGCVANVSASRVSPAPQRRMEVWAPEGYAGLDFARRHLTLVQPSEQLRRGLDPRKLTSAGLATFREELYGRHLQMLELDRNHGDQLTRELQAFVDCVRQGTRPRVGGEEGRDALALAAQVLQSIQAHQWEGDADGPAGSSRLPAPLGPLFRTFESQAAA